MMDTFVSRPTVFARARCYSRGHAYCVELIPAVRNAPAGSPGGSPSIPPGDPWPSPRCFPTLGEAMAWAYEVGNVGNRCLEGLSLISSRQAEIPPAVA